MPHWLDLTTSDDREVLTALPSFVLTHAEHYFKAGKELDSYTSPGAILARKARMGRVDPPLSDGGPLEQSPMGRLNFLAGELLQSPIDFTSMKKVDGRRLADRVLLLTWIMTDPDADRRALGITAWQRIPWEATGIGNSRRSLRDTLFAFKGKAWMRLVRDAWTNVRDDAAENEDVKRRNEAALPDAVVLAAQDEAIALVKATNDFFIRLRRPVMVRKVARSMEDLAKQRKPALFRRKIIEFATMMKQKAEAPRPQVPDWVHHRIKAVNARPTDTIKVAGKTVSTAHEAAKVWYHHVLGSAMLLGEIPNEGLLGWLTSLRESAVDASVIVARIEGEYAQTLAAWRNKQSNVADPNADEPGEPPHDDQGTKPAGYESARWIQAHSEPGIKPPRLRQQAAAYRKDKNKRRMRTLKHRGEVLYNLDDVRHCNPKDKIKPA